MKKLSFILLALLLLCSVSSCDFFRGLAGRPLSSEIEAKRVRIEQAQKRAEAVRDSLERARKDSVLRAEKFVADSTFYTDSLLKAGKLRKASSIRNIPSRRLRSRYYVVVGAFSNEANASRLAARYQDAGFSAEPFRYYGKLTAVFVEPCSRITDAMDAFKRIKQLPFAPKEAWILINE
ncbi:MAG: SPOR domain-containing protein [Bacteroidales bacterium]|nr:SPOR domain-containing protein [Bacteroidales bacterium]